MTTYTWDALTQKYRGWRAPVARITLDGIPVLQREWRLISLQCQMSVNMEASTCIITLGNVYDRPKSKFSCEDMMILGSTVEVSLGYVTAMPVFKGYLYEISYELGESAEVTLNCMDVKGVMMESSCIAASGSYREIIQSMFKGPAARGYSLLCGAPKMDLPELDRDVTFNTANLDDFGFLRRTALQWGLECFVRTGELLLRKKPAAGTPLLEFVPGTFHSVSVTFSTVGYVHSVRVRGGTDDTRDGEKKKASAEAVNPHKIAPEGTKAARLMKRLSESYAPDALDQKAAKAMADAELRRRRQKSGDVNINLRGLPELQPGYHVSLKGISPKINGKYYITEVTHQFNESAFSTSAVCGKDD